MFALPDAWVWDFWLVDDGERYHLFFLFASKALRDPQERHYRASVGHAVSDDLTNWTRIDDALLRSDPPAFDDLATWTGCVVRHPDGTWFMFYTGATLTPAGNVQRIGYATSTDLVVWDRNPENPVLEADPRWYEKLADGTWHDEAFRDPWVYQDGDGWRMLITARANTGNPDDRGVIGTAWSADLRAWELQPPLTSPGHGFGQLEVMETVRIDDQRFLLFSCQEVDLSAAQRQRFPDTGVWAVPAGPGGSRWDLREARPLTGHERYVGRVMRDRRSGQHLFLAFHNLGPTGEFVGMIDDPQPIAVVEGRLRLLDPARTTV